MTLQISFLLLLLSVNTVCAGEVYYPERYQKQAKVKGPPYLPFIAKSPGKLFFFKKKATIDSI